MNAGGNRWRSPNQNFGRDRHAALFSRDCVISDVDCDDVMHETTNTVDVKNDDLAYDNDATDCEYIIPLYLNNMSIHAIRDTGNLGPILVSSDLISADQLIPNKYTRLHGAFDRNRSHKVPMTYVELRSPLFIYDENVTVLAAVCELPAGIQCVIGNALFQQHPELTDIVSVWRKVCTNAKMNHTAQDTDLRAQSDTDRQVQNHTDTNGKINSSSELIEHTTSAEESNNSTVVTELSDNRQTDVEQVDYEVTHVISDSRPASASDATEALDAVITTKSAAAAVVTQAASERSKLSDTHAGDKPATDSARRAHGALTSELYDEDRTLTEFGRIDISTLTDIPTKTDTNTTSTEFALEQKSDPALLDLWTKAQGNSVELCNNDGEKRKAVLVPIRRKERQAMQKLDFMANHDKSVLNMIISNRDEEEDDNGLIDGLTNTNIPHAAEVASDNNWQLDLILLGEQLTGDHREALQRLLIKHKWKTKAR